MPTQKTNQAKKVLEKIFHNPETLHGLDEFADLTIEEVLRVTEEKKDQFFVKDLKSGKPRLIWDAAKQKGKPEEIVRQLWVHKLNTTYGYRLT